jgi:hypothetical protein
VNEFKGVRLAEDICFHFRRFVVGLWLVGDVNRIRGNDCLRVGIVANKRCKNTVAVMDPEAIVYFLAIGARRRIVETVQAASVVSFDYGTVNDADLLEGCFHFRRFVVGLFPVRER